MNRLFNLIQMTVSRSPLQDQERFQIFMHDACRSEFPLKSAISDSLMLHFGNESHLNLTETLTPMLVFETTDWGSEVPG